MQAHLESIQRSNPALDSVVVLDAAGQVVASAGAEEADLEVIVGFLSALRDLGDRAAAEAGLGGLETLVIHGPSGFLAIAALDDGRHIVGTTGDRSMTGAVLADLRAASAGVRAEAA